MSCLGHARNARFCSFSKVHNVLPVCLLPGGNLSDSRYISVVFQVPGDYSWKLGDSKWPATLVVLSLMGGMLGYPLLDYITSG